MVYVSANETAVSLNVHRYNVVAAVWRSVKRFGYDARWGCTS
jgi:hypothetical protein